VITDEVMAMKRAFEQGHKVLSPGWEAVSFEAFPEWVSRKLEELVDIASQVDVFFGSDLFSDAAFGPLGQPGDAAAISRLSRRGARFYYQATSWSQTVLNTPVDTRCMELLFDLASLSSAITTGIEQYGPNLLRQIDKAINAPPDDEPRIIKATLHVESLSTSVDRILRKMSRLYDDPDAGEEVGTSVGVPSKGGYLYVLVNPAMEGLVKIGKTIRSPRQRANELGSVTGIPTPFILVFDVHVEDLDEAERYVHAELEDQRVSSNREFFRVSTNEAVTAVLNAQKFVVRRTAFA
jgi:hypothetical protein